MLTIKMKTMEIPSLGFGTYKLTGTEGQAMIEAAIAAGYRHIDTAALYKNEVEVGAAIRASGIARNDIFLTTKVWPDNFKADDFKKAVDESLKRLAVDRVDLLLLHWPNPNVPLAETIAALNSVQERGLARAIGVSNFTTSLIREAVRLSHIPLAVNQVEYHPYLDQRKVLAEMRLHGMALTAYQPIAGGKVAKDPVLQEIGARHEKTPVQVALRWLVQQDKVAAIPKTSSIERMRENIQIFDFTLTDAEMQRISALHRPDGRTTNPATVAPVWD